MKRIITNTLIILTIGSTFILCEEKAQANRWTPSKYDDPANHSEAYNDGHRQGVESARKREQYRQRVVGGEFARGFKDGYDGRYNKPNPIVTDKICNQLPTNSVNPARENIQRVFEQDEKDRLLRQIENRRKK